MVAEYHQQVASEKNVGSVTAHRRASRRLVISVCLAVLVLVGFVVVAVRIASESSTTLASSRQSQLILYAPGKQHAPDAAALQRLGGGDSILVGGATGKPAVVNFFASWCTACQKELGAVASVARAGRVRFIGVDTDETSYKEALRLLHRAGATYPVAKGNASLAEEYGTGALPTTAFLNGRGQIVALYLGALTRKNLEYFVAALLAGKPL